MRRLLPLWFVLMLLSTGIPATAQEDGLFVAFNFDTLWFKLHPAGMKSSDPGSVLEILAEDVRIEGVDATDLRHCLDGWDWRTCSYGNLTQNLGGNQNGQVEANEVTTFQTFAFALESIPKVENLTRLVKENITVDNKHAANPAVDKLILQNALGDVNSTATIHAFVTVKAAYANEKSAPAHEVNVRALDLLREGFSYGTCKWTVEAEGWRWAAAETRPTQHASRVTESGWTSNQTQFESATAGPDGLTLVAEQASTPAKKAFPLIPVLLALGGLVLLVLLVLLLRRRQR